MRDPAKAGAFMATADPQLAALVAGERAPRNLAGRETKDLDAKVPPTILEKAATKRAAQHLTEARQDPVSAQRNEHRWAPQRRAISTGPLTGPANALAHTYGAAVSDTIAVQQGRDPRSGGASWKPRGMATALRAHMPEIPASSRLEGDRPWAKGIEVERRSDGNKPSVERVHPRIAIHLASRGGTSLSFTLIPSTSGSPPTASPAVWVRMGFRASRSSTRSWSERPRR